MLRLAQNMKNTVLAALAIEGAMTYAAQSTQQRKELLVDTHFLIAGMLTFLVVMNVASFLGDDACTQIFLATAAAGSTQITAFRAAGADAYFIYTHR